MPDGLRTAWLVLVFSALLAAAAFGVLALASGAPVASAEDPPGTLAASVNAVETLDDTAGGYIDAPTPGPHVRTTVPASGRVLVTLSAQISSNYYGAGMGVMVLGPGYHIWPDDSRALRLTSPPGGRGSFSFTLGPDDGLQPGDSIIVSAWYRGVGQTIVGYRTVSVTDLR